jgi:ABC-type multidrug transport system permease subunit
MKYAIETSNLKKRFLQREKGKRKIIEAVQGGPGWLRFIAYFNLMYYVVEASRVPASGAIDSSKAWQAFIVMTPLTAIGLWWATQVYRKAVS